MANKTSNYNLIKPDEKDYYDINVSNGNMDIIDAQLKKTDTNQNEIAAHLQNEINAIEKAKGQPNGYAGLDENGNIRPMPTAAQLGLGNVDNTHDGDKSVKYAASAGSAPAAGGWAQTANYSTHAVGINDFGLRGNYIANWGPSGGADGDTWDQY